MSELHDRILLILDDREIVSGEVCMLVGNRHFGEIIFKRQPLLDHFKNALPSWMRDRFVHLQSPADLVSLRQILETGSEDCAALVIAGRAGFKNSERLTQLIERLPYAEESFTDRLYKPLLVYYHNAHNLVDRWSEFEIASLHTWEQAWQDYQRVESVELLDLAKIRDFLTYTCGSTATRHFNEMQIDAYYYTKRSKDKSKIRAECLFYDIAPEALRPWLIETFNYQDEGEWASYKMLRYYLADASLQWVHGAFDIDTYGAFVDRLLFFLSVRPSKHCSKEASLAVADSLFLNKPAERVDHFLSMEVGKRINNLAASSTAELELLRQLDRYKRLFKEHENGFKSNHLVVGHGDPCFSNILYDQQRYLLKLIDPRGAHSEEDLWTHPIYDLCKISHSALGDYDFINNGLYNVGFTDINDLVLCVDHINHEALKLLFVQRVQAQGYDCKVMRLGEASLFLSMLPLHIDNPNKVLAFLLKAKQILDEVEYGY